jgi:hypothetical protein
MSESRSSWNVLVPNWASLFALVFACGILAVLIFAAITSSIHDARRAQCAANLKQIGEALSADAFEGSGRGPWPTAFTKDSVAWNDVGNTRTDQLNPTQKDAQAETEAGDKGAAIAVNSGTASLWLLMRSGIIDNPAVFICPETDHEVETDVADLSSVRDFRGERFCSYSYQNTLRITTTAAGPRPYILNSSAPSGLAVAADANPMRRDFWSGAPGGVAEGVTDRKLAKEPHLKFPGNDDAGLVQRPWELNSPNHKFVGQNVLYRDGHVSFNNNPYCGIQYDNIWLRRRTDVEPAPGATDLELIRASNDEASYNGTSVLSKDNKNDSFLVP